MKEKRRTQTAIESFCGTMCILLRRNAPDIFVLTKMPNASRMRAQSAMEYLVTYGWALLALFAVLAILISSGAFSTSNFTNPECTFQPDLPCNSFILYKNSSSGTARLIFNITNGLGFNMSIGNITYSVVDMGDAGKHEYTDLFSPQVGMRPGASYSFSHDFTGPKQPNARDFRTVYVSITYSNCRFASCSGNYTTSGRVSAIVESG